MNANRASIPISAIIIMVCLLLGGCGLGSQSREVEQLLVVETMGLDYSAEGVSLSLASGAGDKAEGSPQRLHAVGPSVTAAIERIRAGANEEELFCAHIGQVLLGESSARQGLTRCLDYICRSDELRMSVPLYILRGGEAGEAVLGVGNDSFGVCDALRSVESDLRGRGDGRSVPAAEIARDLARRGCALACAVRLEDSSEDDRSVSAQERPKNVLPAGYAVLKNDRLIGWIDRDLAVAAGLLLGRSGLCEVVVTDQAGLPLTLTLRSGSAGLEPQWDDGGQLAGLTVQIEAEALLAEGTGGATSPDYLRRMLERELSDRVRRLLLLSRGWEADFLGLEETLSLRHPARMQAQTRPFASLWPTLPLQISVSARLSGTGDWEDAR